MEIAYSSEMRQTAYFHEVQMPTVRISSNRRITGDNLRRVWVYLFSFCSLPVYEKISLTEVVVWKSGKTTKP
jgi:hypothetical protein